MLLVTQHSHFKLLFYVLQQATERRSLVRLPPRVSQTVTLPSFKVLPYISLKSPIMLSAQNLVVIGALLVDSCSELVDKPEPIAGEYNSKQKGSSVVLRTICWNSLCDRNVSIL